MKHKDYTKFSNNSDNKFQNDPVQPEDQNVVPPVDNPEKPEAPTANPELVNNEDNKQNDPVQPEDQNVVPTIDNPVQPEAPTANQATNLIAMVTNCTRLNVRKEANKNSKVVCVIANGNEVAVDLDASTEDFYKVHTVVNDVLVEGYCVKEFIEIK